MADAIKVTYLGNNGEQRYRELHGTVVGLIQISRREKSENKKGRH
jgi:hypothetical protein